MTRLSSILVCLFCISQIIISQSAGTWKPYLAYNNTTAVTETNNHIFAVADGSLFSYSKEDNAITYYSKKNGLNDNQIIQIGFNPDTNTLLIIYSNGNLDLWGEEGIHNLPYLKNSANITNKAVNDLFFYNEYAYLSTEFGILVVNMKKNEITDTYKLNQSVYSVCVKDAEIYAATSTGILKGSLNDNLLDINNWQIHPITNINSKNIRKLVMFNEMLCFYVKQSGAYYQQHDGTTKSILVNNAIKNMAFQNEKLILYTNSRLYIYSSLTTSHSVETETINGVSSFKKADTYWIASGTAGLKGIKKKNTSDEYDVILQGTNDETSSPKRNLNYFMTFDENKLFIAGGGRWTNRYNNPGTLLIYDTNKWFNLDEQKVNKLANIVCKDYTGIAIDPADPEHYFVSVYGEGILEFNKNEFVKLHNHQNSTLSSIFPGASYENEYIRIGGITFDKKGNLWATNCEVNDVVKVLKADGKWTTIHFNKLSNSGASYMIDKILITSKGRKWINIPYSNYAGIFVFDDKGTIDNITDENTELYRSFQENGKENQELNGSFCAVEDKTGIIWIGTGRGPVICTNPNSDITNLSFTRIIRPTNDGSGSGYAFLDGQRVNAIAVDGGNRKWMGTESSGIFLVSEDGMETIANFTTDNSPLLSNTIHTLAINQQSGEVFIGTDKGLISYMSDATQGSEDYSDVYAYPNPVRPEMQDHVTVTGLMENSNVKITDLNGNIIYQGKSAGGTFTWNCRNGKGGRVATGIYLVLSATPDSKESVVTKILVVK